MRKRTAEARAKYARICELWVAGKSYTEIAVEVQAGRQTVSNALRANPEAYQQGRRLREQAGTPWRGRLAPREN